jgi:hypothetical protein
MLTCINPDVSFSDDHSTTIKVCGVAVSLKCLYSLITLSGKKPPPEKRMRQEVLTLGIAATKSKTQFFNKMANGMKITRRAAIGVEVVSNKCIIVRHSAFGVASWAVFSEGTVTYVHNSL